MFFFNGIYVPNLQLSFFGFLMYFFIILSQIFTKILIKLAYICFDSNICKHGAIDPAQNKFSVSPEFSVSSENIFHNSQIYLVLYLCGQVQQIKEYELKFWYQRIVQIPGFSFNSYTTMNIFLIYQRFFFSSCNMSIQVYLEKYKLFIPVIHGKSWKAAIVEQSL